MACDSEFSGNIIVLGFGAAGALVVRKLLQNRSKLRGRRVIVVEKNDFAFWPIAAVRAPVVEKWASLVFKHLTELKSDPDFELKTLTEAVSLDFRENLVVLKNEAGDLQRIPWEELIITTGCTYGLPCRPSSHTIKDARVEMLRLQSQLQKATHVVIIGAGPVGIELAGEVKVAYPSKEVTLVCSNDRLLAKEPYKKALGKSLERHLERVDVAIIYGDRVLDSDKLASGPVASESNPLKILKTKEGRELNADFVFIAHGNRPNSHLLQEEEGVVNSDTNEIHVDNTLQVKGFKNVWAAGDVTDIEKVKLARSILGQAEILAHNVIANIHGSSNHKQLGQSSLKQSITVGPNRSSGQIGNKVYKDLWLNHIFSAQYAIGKFNSFYKAVLKS